MLFTVFFNYNSFNSLQIAKNDCFANKKGMETVVIAPAC